MGPFSKKRDDGCKLRQEIKYLNLVPILTCLNIKILTRIISYLIQQQ